jgi:pyruvate dehydrogenase E1 component
MKKSKENAVDFAVVNAIAERAYYMALRMIAFANSRPNIEKGEPKVGGHPTACGSSQHILTAIHMVMREPEDYFAFKPHISPMDHALNYLLHNFRDKDGNIMEASQRELAMHHLRHYSREGEPVFQSYHAESDPDSFRYFPSGSVGIPPVNALYTSLAYKFAKDHKFGLEENPTFWCLMGDSEFREGSLHEAMPDAGERQLGNLVWIVDYNRQNLDGTRVFNESAMGGTDAERIAKIGEANGWRSMILKHGKIRQRLFATPGGEEFHRVLDNVLTDFEYQALLGSRKIDLVRKVLGEKSPALKTWLKNLNDTELYIAFTNLAGHDIESLVEAFTEAKKDPNRPTLIVPYTIKGYNLRVAALSGNHSAMPEEEELQEMAKNLGTDYEEPFQEFPEGSAEAKYIEARREYLVDGIQKLSEQIRDRKESWRQEAEKIQFPVDFDVQALKFNPVAHTQWMWGQIAAKLDRLARGDRGTKPDEGATGWAQVSRFFMTMAPDVGSSTNTSPNMNGKLYGDIGQPDFEAEYGAKDEKAPDVVPHADQRTGHIRFEIAEGNCMSAAGSFGKFFHFAGIPFYPAMTIYDFFIKRCLDQFYYNVYWHSDFATIGTPSGVTLAPEGAQHSWKSDIQMPNCITWEPFYAKELEWILADTLRRHFTRDNEGREAALIRCVTKGQLQKAFLENLKRQSRFKTDPSVRLTLETEAETPSIEEQEIWETIRQEALLGAYPLVDYRGYEDYCPGDNVVHLFAMGALCAEALKASAALHEKGIYANVFVVTSPDLLLGNYAELDGYTHLKKNLGISGELYLSPSREIGSEAEWVALQGSRIPIVSVHDGEPGLLDNIGSVVGVKQKSLAIRKTSKSGTTKDIFYYHHIDAEGIEGAAEEILAATAEEKIIVRQEILESPRSSSNEVNDLSLN